MSSPAVRTYASKVSKTFWIGKVNETYPTYEITRNSRATIGKEGKKNKLLLIFKTLEADYSYKRIRPSFLLYQGDGKVLKIQHL